MVSEYKREHQTVTTDNGSEEFKDSFNLYTECHYKWRMSYIASMEYELVRKYLLHYFMHRQ